MTQAKLTELQNILAKPHLPFREAVQWLRSVGCAAPEMTELSAAAEKQFVAPRLIEKCRTLLFSFNQLPPSVPNDLPKQPEEKSDDPDVIVQLRKEQRELRDERRALHYTLEDTLDRKLRAEKCRHISSLTKKIDRIFSQLDDYRNAGIVPSIATTEVVRKATADISDLFVQKKYLTERTSRLRSWLQSGKKSGKPLTPAQKFKYEKQLDEYIAKLSIVTKEIENLD